MVQIGDTKYWDNSVRVKDDKDYLTIADYSSLPLNTDKYSYRFYKNLNEDVKLVSDEYGEWDIDFDYENEDWVNVDGFDSLSNACILAIMTRFNELEFMSLYEDFGCRVHELVKANKIKLTLYNMELFITEVLESMRRVREVNWVKIKDLEGTEFNYNYLIRFSVSSTVDSQYNVDDVKTELVEGSFKI